MGSSVYWNDEKDGYLSSLNSAVTMKKSRGGGVLSELIPYSLFKAQGHQGRGSEKLSREKNEERRGSDANEGKVGGVITSEGQESPLITQLADQSNASLLVV